MKRSLSFLFIIPNVVLVTTLFWFLTTIGQYFYKKEDSSSKKENFECGFENTALGESQINFKNSTVLSFLVLYDIELILVLPLSFNWHHVIDFGVYTLVAVLFVVFGTCSIDLEVGTLEFDN